MNISIIVSHGNNYELGLDNKLLWHIPKDLLNFKMRTTGHHVLMGRKTYESIGRILPDRTSLIITHDPDYSVDDKNVFVYNDIDVAIQSAIYRNESELFIIGGAPIYNTCIHKADTLYVTKVNYSGEADVFLKPINYDGYILVEEENHMATEKTPSWCFQKYVKR